MPILIDSANSLTTADVLVLGAGMAGASVAAELARDRSVLLLETEDQPGRHATGRSAAMFSETYGNATIRALTSSSRAFLEHPPAGFCEVSLLTPRGCIFVADATQMDRLNAMLSSSVATGTLGRIALSDALGRVPILRRDWLAGAAFDPAAHDIDVAALHQGYLRAARRAGAHMAFGAGEVGIERQGGSWRVSSRAGTFEAPVLVNAAGAWADVVAEKAGACTVGLRPMRRTVVTLPAPAHLDIGRWPMVIDADESFYFKPDAGQLLLSPANEDASLPCDAVPDELDVAIAVDRFERATIVEVKRVTHRWAGLRSFVSDRTPVVGFDDGVAGFFWLAGQGGYGIQTAPAMARMAAALIVGRPVPTDIAERGVTAAALSPSRASIKT